MEDLMHRALVGATLAVAFVGVTVLAQTPPPSSAPLTPILGGKKFAPPVKGDASIDFLASPTKREGAGANAVLVTKFQVKNTSNAPIARLKIVETWYDKDGSVIPGGEASINGLLQPGEVQPLEIRTPVNMKMAQSKLQFVHANGGIPKPHRVTKFDGEDSKEPAAKTAAATKAPAKPKKKG
ncbi:MAG TPA: hypothetical protein VGY57_08350 [Vicinamibacterales bacterium]|nr:hypothetical protein [Vicinamibacterales bacterium]